MKQYIYIDHSNNKNWIIFANDILLADIEFEKASKIPTKSNHIGCIVECVVNSDNND